MAYVNAFTTRVILLLKAALQSESAASDAGGACEQPEEMVATLFGAHRNAV